MSWSVTEIAALAAKAARGAGAPPAQAARFGQAAACHLAAGREAGTLSRALDALPKGPIMVLPLVLDEAASAAWSGGVQVFTLPGGLPTDLLESYVSAMPYNTTLKRSGDERMRLTLDVARPRGAKVSGRIDGCDALIEALSRLAERTFVPESEVSRTAGAGAGLNDND
jgi:hypothetical protein